MVARVAHELTLFAAVGFLIGGVSDLIVDAIWIARSAWRRFIVRRMHPRGHVASLSSPRVRPRFAVFVPAWQEAGVVGCMLRHATSVWGGEGYAIFVGTYANDPATQACARSLISPTVRVVVNERAGPTTKADCLNALWGAMLADERRSGERYSAIVLHDAEDVVHRDELKLFAALIDRFDLIQLPVFPLVDPQSRWIAGHYIDEFATHHTRSIVAREVAGAGLPSAGVGCAFRRETLAKLSQPGGPFDEESLTEDYELGLRVARAGGRAALVRLAERPGGPLVGVWAHFPADLQSAVTQKARWIAGIALAGWDRLGWGGGLAETWMRLDDRRAPLAALVLLAAYLALVLNVLLLIPAGLGLGTQRPDPALSLMLTACLVLMAWRMLLRSVLVARGYGWREGLRAVPRTLVANVIDMMAARRAVGLYLRARRSGRVVWDKTAHKFPGATA